MKTLSLLIVIFAMFATPSFAKSKHHETVTVLSTKRYIFYFKVEKCFIGANIEVVNSDNQVVHTESVMHSRNILDFFYLAPGHYTIKLHKNNEVYTFEYDNKE